MHQEQSHREKKITILSGSENPNEQNTEFQLNTKDLTYLLITNTIKSLSLIIKLF